ncbi:MAG: maleylacetoacetate isomerase [Pseudomonadota bacterium]
MTLRLHNFFRSSTSVRVRAALNLKGLAYDYAPYVLRAGETRTEAYLARNPQGLVPALELPNGEHLTQSLAIIEWLEETRPAPPLLPDAPEDRARVRAIAQSLACEVHPLGNLRVLFDIRDRFGADEAAQAEWFRRWVRETFDPLERMLSDDARTGGFCHGDAPTMADLCLFAQVLNNRRFDLPPDDWPTIARIHAACLAVPEIAAAAPERQPDAA